MAEKYILAIMVSFVFVTLLVALGMPSEYQLMTGFDFAWFTGGIVAVTAGCVVITGIPCAILEASFGILTIIQYGLGAFFGVTPVDPAQLIKAIVLTPISILAIYIISRLARGSG